MFSNGQLLKESLAEKILPYLTFLRFSFNGGNAATYSNIHKVKEKVFDTVVQNITKSANIKKQNRKDGKGFRYRKKARFRKQSYKKQRGIVEIRYAAIENAGLTLTHYRIDDTRFKYGLILEIKQNIDNLLRLEIERLFFICQIIQQIQLHSNI